MDATRSRRAALWAALGVATLVLVAGGALAALSLRVEGTSMSPTLSGGQRVLTTPGSAAEAHRFDVVVARRPGDGAAIVKRVIGLPGDLIRIVGSTPDDVQVQVRPAGARTWLRVDAPTWRGRWTDVTTCCSATGRADGSGRARRVPTGRVFLMGDDPATSADSRAFGWVRVSDIEGRVGMRVWPLGAAGGIGNRPVLRPAA